VNPRRLNLVQQSRFHPIRRVEVRKVGEAPEKESELTANCVY
jgi:hypothetical protein